MMAFCKYTNNIAKCNSCLYVAPTNLQGCKDNNIMQPKEMEGLKDSNPEKYDKIVKILNNKPRE